MGEKQAVIRRDQNSVLFDRITELSDEAVAKLGLSVLEVQWVSRVLRITLEGERSPDLEKITEASKLISAILDGEDELPSGYELEVSSPGVERPLFTARHYQLSLGRLIKMELLTDGKDHAQLNGRLVGVDNEEIEVEIGETVTGKARASLSRVIIPLRSIVSARTLFEWPKNPKESKGKQQLSGSVGDVVQGSLQEEDGNGTD